MARFFLHLRTVVVLGIAALFLTGCGGANLSEMVTNPTSLGICGVLALILALVAIIEVAGSSRSTGGKVLWILILIFLPYIGVICYYLFADRS